MTTTFESSRIGLSRRRFISALTALSAMSATAACGSPKPGRVAGPPDADAPETVVLSRALDDRFAAIEDRYVVRLGVHARSTASGRTYAYRADDRFAMCSTFKVYAAAAILRLESEGALRLDEAVPIDPQDIVVHSPVTSEHQGRVMTIDRLCDAALTRSDNTAGNLLLRRLGGPDAITAFARSVGDGATRLDRWEPELNTADRGDERDTTTPSGLARGFEAVLLGSALPAAQQRTLLGWMRATTTSDTRIRAGLPPGWTSADKTGGGMHGTVNDAGAVWSPEGDPLLLVILSDSTTGHPDAPLEGGPVAEATAALVDVLHAVP
ncbi:class A beta-lactamase [Rhodococcus sp. CH91]|uniref:class A beta-lactamase n=1 Tax=Rhodococcus sp. CH91 TaxID=2910256 RepID=UPI001F4A40D9|nr:class A beta-lactamase [Rhodococcus sp. CH91]